MIRVAHFICSSGLYGAERWILALLNHINGIESLLICPDHHDLSLLEEAKSQGLNTRLLPVKGKNNLIDCVQKLSGLIEKENIDILHTHGYKSDLLGYFATRKSGIRIISTPHGWSSQEGLKLRIYESFDKFILIFFDMVVPLSEEIKKTLKHVHKSKLLVINNFVDLDSLPSPKRGNPKLIIFIGRLVQLKGVQDLIIALKHIQNENIKLYIIGEGPLHEKLIALRERLNLREKVEFFGYRKDRLNLLNSSEIVVQPSLSEGTPRTIMEAMALKKVVIGSDIPGIRKLIKNKETGLLVPVKDPKKIAEAIDYILKNKKHAEQMAQEARNLIATKFNVKLAAKEYESLYSKISAD